MSYAKRSPVNPVQLKYVQAELEGKIVFPSSVLLAWLSVSRNNLNRFGLPHIIVA